MSLALGAEPKRTSQTTPCQYRQSDYLRYFGMKANLVKGICFIHCRLGLNDADLSAANHYLWKKCPGTIVLAGSTSALYLKVPKNTGIYKNVYPILCVSQKFLPVWCRVLGIHVKGISVFSFRQVFRSRVNFPRISTLVFDQYKIKRFTVIFKKKDLKNQGLGQFQDERAIYNVVFFIMPQNI